MWRDDPGMTALCSWEWVEGHWIKGQCAYRISKEVELLRAEMSRVRISEISSPELGPGALRDWWVSCSGISGVCGKLWDWWGLWEALGLVGFLFHSLFSASGPWGRIGRLS